MMRRAQLHMLGDDVLYLPIRELQANLRKRSFSPVELAKSYLQRSEINHGIR